MKTAFRVRVKAKTAHEAFEQVGSQYGKVAFSVVVDTVDDLIKLFDQKLARARSNPIYADKVKEYLLQLERITLLTRIFQLAEAEIVVEAMLAHGSDPRIDNPHRCGVIKAGEDQFIVFGFLI